MVCRSSKASPERWEVRDKVIWAAATQRKVAADDEIVVAPVLSGNFLGCRIKDGRKDKRKPDEETVAGRIQRSLVVRKVRGKMEAMEMRTVFDADYEPRVKNGQVDPSNFEGKVYFFDVNGKLVNGLIYEEGRQVATFGPNKGGRTTDMVEVCTDWYHQGCVDGYGCSGWVYQETTCEMVYVSDGGSFIGDIFITALDIVLTAGSDIIFEALMMIPSIAQLWADLKQKEKDYFMDRKWLLPQAAAARLAAKELTWLFFCRDDDDGNWNAFKHAMWSGLLCMYFGTSTALQMTDNHEDGEPQWKKTMDEFNNALGINTFKSLSASLAGFPPTMIPVKVAKIGEAILKRIENGQGVRHIPENAPAGTQTQVSTNGNDQCF